MQLSVSFCRTQQALHKDRASSALLDNVRIVAEKAAAAWGLEAEIADRRDAQRERARLDADSPTAADAFEDEDNAIFSESLDRGLRED